MAKFEKRIEARKLRRRGWSIGDIAKHIRISKSSASAWCIDLELTGKQKELLRRKVFEAGNAGRAKGALMNRQKKLERIKYHRDEGGAEVGALSKRDFLMAGLGVYWGEGTKKSGLALVNSDPQLVLFMFNWFKISLEVKNEDFRPRIFINEIHRPRAEKVLTFWSHLLGLPQDQFGNTVFLKIRNKKVYENHDSYYGVIALRVQKGTDLKYRILGLIEALHKQKAMEFLPG